MIELVPNLIQDELMPAPTFSSCICSCPIAIIITSRVFSACLTLLGHFTYTFRLFPLSPASGINRFFLPFDKRWSVLIPFYKLLIVYKFSKEYSMKVYLITQKKFPDLIYNKPKTLLKFHPM
ncbi:hypothetical protein LCGC14_1599550 [marine sediment metagenome]|uniref:Uncharacterized protein n=1 Tax=marine sediment metagenome TaxID=412755 RepID=A0A0F9IBW8_9ZZZZ